MTAETNQDAQGTNPDPIRGIQLNDGENARGRTTIETGTGHTGMTKETDAMSSVIPGTDITKIWDAREVTVTIITLVIGDIQIITGTISAIIGTRSKQASEMYGAGITMNNLIILF